MTPITYSYLKDQGFKLIIPIVSQNDHPDEVLTMWGKEFNNKVIRLEYHSSKPLQATSNDDDPPFLQEGLRLYLGEKGSPDLSFEGTVFYTEEIESYLSL